MVHSIASILIAALLAASIAYWLLAWWCTRRFFRKAINSVSDFLPRVSLLKPIKGVDPSAAENFASFCRQDYSDYEILFGVADERDPAAALVQALQREFPQLAIRLIVAP